MYSYGTPHMAGQKQDDQLEHTYNSYVRIRDVALKTCLKRCTIGRSSERGFGISVLAARHDDDDVYTCKKKLATVVEGDLKTFFSIATLWCREGCYSILWILPLTLDTYHIMLSKHIMNRTFLVFNFFFAATFIRNPSHAEIPPPKKKKLIRKSLWAKGNEITTVIITLSHRQRLSPWPSPATFLYRPSLPVSLQGYILYRHRAVLYRF